MESCMCVCARRLLSSFSRRICTDVARGRDTPPQQQQQRDALRHRPLNEITHICLCLCIGQIERHLLMGCVSIEKLSVHKNVFAHSVYCANAMLFVNYDIRESRADTPLFNIPRERLLGCMGTARR